MNETRNPKIKELILTSEVIKENIIEFENKLAEEKSKYNKLLDDTVELEKTQANMNIELYHIKLDNDYLSKEIAAKAAESKALKLVVDGEEEKLVQTKERRDRLELEIKDLREKQEALAK